MSEKQRKRMQSYVLPETVYRQALWAVKDLPRMRKKLEELEDSLDSMPQAYSGMPRGGSGPADLTALRAGEMAGLSMRIRAIEESLGSVPETYRDSILDKLAYGVPYPDYVHMNTWKKWQQVYLYQVAVALRLY